MVNGQPRDLAGEPAGGVEVVGVAAAEQFSPRAAATPAFMAAEMPLARAFDDADSRVVQPADDVGRAVGRSVVDYDDFEVNTFLNARGRTAAASPTNGRAFRIGLRRVGEGHCRRGDALKSVASGDVLRSPIVPVLGRGDACVARSASA